MSAIDLLRDLVNRDVRLSLRAGRVNMSAPKGAITSELLVRLRQHETEILTLLATQVPAGSPVTADESGGPHAIGAACEAGASRPVSPADTDEDFVRRSGLISGPLPSFAPDDWRRWYAERIAALQRDGLPGEVALRWTHETAVVAWGWMHPPAPGRSRCHGCGEPLDTAGHHRTPLADGATIHYGGSYGLACWRRHSEQRREKATEALRMMGITEPAHAVSERAAVP